ncbi:hypothetical protein [Actinokineospora xionganensis]|uniref:SPW repeat-containing protein n=1 Tax=Actinokineospora xionganensis TaxID=2684470 RepID=A0ABR7KZG5_9PSEU|nr:hypothetical protein [Actinokineospora xionganensis]MBC6445829.1 hypothetical protein [Actinokineospora xionganensis]
MNLTWRDATSSLLVAAILVPYAWFVGGGGALLVHDARGVAATGLVFGIAACVVGARVNGERMPALPQALALAAAVFGVLTLVIDAAWSLTFFIATAVLLWAFTTVRHALAYEGRHRARAQARS